MSKTSYACLPQVATSCPCSQQWDASKLSKALTYAGSYTPRPPTQILTCYSIESIASADIETISTAINDSKAAKSLQTACKGLVKAPSKKRAAETSFTSTSKRTKSAYELSAEPQTPQEIEKALELPQPSEDEEKIEKTTIYTNRAPLVLAFAVQLLKYTMPEQPLSSRLSLAQAVVSANSRSKAQSLGIEKGRSAEELGWGQGQPKVKVMGREISVLKRSGYDWREGQSEVKEGNGEASGPAVAMGVNDEAGTNPMLGGISKESGKNDWTVSASVTSKKSTFVARAIAITSPFQARSEFQKLLAASHDLRDASHNITAWRVAGDHGIIEDSNDDGESGGGRHILGLLQSSDIVGVLLVVTRWYGGIMLGVDRWRIMSQVSRDALSQRLQVTGIVGGEALWGLDLEAMKSTDAPVTDGTAGGMPVYRPEGARMYILKAFASPPASADEKAKKKKTGVALEREKEENLGLLLGALDLLFSSWVEHISRDELDRKAWGWYVQVRPEVEGGVAGWGGKGDVKLADILNLRRKQ
jgi:hypothetical protein